MPKICRFALIPNEEPTTTATPRNKMTSLRAYSAYGPPNFEVLVRYLHTAEGFPMKQTWLNAIKAGNFDTWPGLTYSIASKYFPQAAYTIKGHTTLTKQGVRSTKVKPPMVAARAHAPQQKKSTTNKVHIYKTTISKL